MQDGVVTSFIPQSSSQQGIQCSLQNDHLFIVLAPTDYSLPHKSQTSSWFFSILMKQEVLQNSPCGVICLHITTAPITGQTFSRKLSNILLNLPTFCSLTYLALVACIPRGVLPSCGSHFVVASVPLPIHRIPSMPMDSTRLGCLVYSGKGYPMIFLNFFCYLSIFKLQY